MLESVLCRGTIFQIVCEDAFTVQKREYLCGYQSSQSLAYPYMQARLRSIPF